MSFSHPPSYLPSLSPGLVPDGHHYYEGSESSAKHRSLLLAEVSLLNSIELLNIPSPTTALPFRLPQFGTLPGFFYTVQAVPPTVGTGGPTGSPSLGRCVESEVHLLLGGSPTGLAESSSHSLRTVHSPLVALHLFFENAVTISYGAVTDSPIGTFTRQFNRLHRRTSYRRQTVGALRLTTTLWRA